jgi:hypothetical protein
MFVTALAAACSVLKIVFGCPRISVKRLVLEQAGKWRSPEVSMFLFMSKQRSLSGAY